jgi:Ca2+/Na+ antiporter
MDSLKSGALTVANDQLKLIKDPLIYKMFLLFIIVAAILFYINKKAKEDKKQRNSAAEYILVFFFMIPIVSLLNFFEFTRHPRAWFEQMFVFGLLYFLYVLKSMA